MKVFSTIETLIPKIGGWTSVPKAQTFAAMVLAFRPHTCVEIGVWEGRGSLSIALALKELGRGRLHSIDAWSPEASVEGQNKQDADHWKTSNHDAALAVFQHHLEALGLSEIVDVIRAKSDQVIPPKDIGFLVIDGNHGDTAIADVNRYAPNVRKGGICYMDDLDWSTGSVRRAEAKLKSMGFVELYPLETGAVYQKLA